MPGGRTPDLARSDDEDLVLDGPGPEQEFPVGRAGGGGEGGRDRHDRGPRQGHDPVELGEPEVVAEGQAEDHRRVTVRGAGPIEGDHHASAPGAMVSDSRKATPARATSNRWILR